MDLNDDEKSVKFRQLPHFNSRCFESKAGQLFVRNVNPFNTVGGHAGDVKENLINKGKNDEFIDMYDKTPIRDPNNSPSRVLVNEIIKNCPFHKNVYIERDPYDDIDDIHEAFMGNQIPDRLYSQPIVSMSANLCDSQYLTSCSRGDSKPKRYDHQDTFDEYDEDNNRRRTLSNDEMLTEATADGTGRAEKQTYCRPLLNMYNQEFVYKTMQKNARLQKLVRKLVIEREREKQREAWNNYINELKNKHRYYSNEPSRISPQYVPDENNTPVMVDDFYNTRFSWRQSNPCQNFLQELYESHDDTMLSSVYDRYPRDYYRNLPPEVESCMYDNNRLCYPTSSQANLVRWNRDRYGNQFAYEWRQRPSGRFFRGGTIVIEKEQKQKCCLFDKIQGTARPHLKCTRTAKTCTCKNKMCSIIRSSSIPVQTENASGSASGTPLPLVNEEDDKELTVPIPKKPFPGIPISMSRFKKDKNIVPQSQEPSKQDKDLNVPQKEETPLLSEKDVNVPLKQEPSKSDKDALGFMKSDKDAQSFSKSDKDAQSFTKSDTDAQGSYEAETSKQTSDKDVNVPHRDFTSIFKKIVKPSKKDKGIDTPRKGETLKERFNKVTENIARLKDKIRQSELETVRFKSLAQIENKIDCLMKSINSIMIDIKTRKALYPNKKSATVSCAFITNSCYNLDRRRSDPHGIIKSEEFLCSMVQTNSSRNLTISEIGPSDLKRHRESSTSKIDQILLEEMKKSEKIKRDIEELLSLRQDRSCSVQIMFDIPTKERSTEVTDSLYKAKPDPVTHVRVEEIPRSDQSDDRHTQMTIAVNTDPLGLLALLRVSAETVRQMLSYVPNLNYNSYLSMLQLPSRQGISHYICNICGAAFTRPSQLSDHIEQHNLGRTRDCCVCRHTLDMQRTRVGLFTCRYCGQRFTRAYCCELHQQTCAASMGRRHDVTSSHILLR